MKEIICKIDGSLSAIEIEQIIADSGFWISLNPDVSTLSNGSFSANNLRLSIIHVKRSVTIDGIGLNVTTAATGALSKIGLYTNGSDNKPGSLITTLGEIDCSVAGQNSLTISNYTIEPGLYWCALVNNLSISFPNLAGINNLYSQGATSITASGVLGYRIAHTYTDPLPSSITSPANEFSAPHIYFRKV
ncbi:hypothetical protein [Dolichospermum phage Dfl-JY23]